MGRPTAPVRTCRSAASRIPATGSANPAPKRSTSIANGRRSSSTTCRARFKDTLGMADKRRICFPITSRAYYGRSQALIKKLHAHPGVDLKLMLGGSILLDKYSRHIADDIEAGG